MNCDTCTVCKKPSSSFYKHNKSTCKQCLKQRSYGYKENDRIAANGRLDARKQCSKCKVTKARAEFSTDSSRAGGLQSQCKTCSSKTGLVHRRQKQQRHSQQPDEQTFCRTCQTWMANKDFRPTKQQCKACLAKIKCERWATDEQYRCKELASARYRRELKKYGMDKTRAISQLIGCSPAELRQHIESQFSEGMSWDNHGNGKGYWNLDHIIACARFNLTIEAEQNKCFHYTNLQPLWWIDNMRKGARLDWMPEMADGIQTMMRG